jgi:hypothetical protein
VIRNHRAASEIIGFVLVFSLILGTITIVYVGGLSGLDDARNAERVNNAERAFDVMANNFQQMGRGDAPNRATEIKLADAQLSTSGNRQVSIDSSEMSTAAAASPVTIRYDAPGDSRIVYENGAVIRVDDGEAIMRREPDFLFSDGKAVVRFIELRGSNQGIGGTASTVLVRAERTQSQVLVNRGSSDGVTIEMQTHPDRADVWADYWEEQMEAATGNTVTCDRSPIDDADTVKLTCGEFDVEELIVSRVRVRVTLT